MSSGKNGQQEPDKEHFYQFDDFRDAGGHAKSPVRIYDGQTVADLPRKRAQQTVRGLPAPNLGRYTF